MQDDMVGEMGRRDMKEEITSKEEGVACVQDKVVVVFLIIKCVHDEGSREDPKGGRELELEEESCGEEPVSKKISPKEKKAQRMQNILEKKARLEAAAADFSTGKFPKGLRSAARYHGIAVSTLW